MWIEINNKDKEFYLHINDSSFSATPRGVTILFTKDELIKLIDFANAELQDAEVTRG